MTVGKLAFMIIEALIRYINFPPPTGLKYNSAGFNSSARHILDKPGINSIIDSIKAANTAALGNDIFISLVLI